MAKFETSNQNELTEEEAAKRRDAALKRALGTPPKPHKGRKEKPQKEVDDSS